MRDPTRDEVAAMEAAGVNGGEYLESISKTDLATMTPEEWMTFIECVCTGFVEHLRGGC